MALVPPEGTPAGRDELHSRWRVQDTTVISRVDAREVNLSHRDADPGAMLQRLSGQDVPTQRTNQVGPGCLAGVLRGRLIPFEGMSSTFSNF